MKNLFIFYMITASVVSSVHAGPYYDTETMQEEQDQSMGYQADDESELENELDDITSGVEEIVIAKPVLTYYDYAQVALRACYLYCMQKPYLFCKLYMHKLRLLFKQKKQYE